MLLVALSWMASLFPVSGFIKVGTFIADRLTVAATVTTAVFGSRILAIWVVHARNRNSRRRVVDMVLKSVLILGGLALLWGRVSQRSYEWMTSPDLLESSLQSCPMSAKSNLEISKVYSGLYPEKLDYDLAE